MRYTSSVLLSFYVTKTFSGCCFRVLRLVLEIGFKLRILTHQETATNSDKLNLQCQSFGFLALLKNQSTWVVFQFSKYCIAYFTCGSWNKEIQNWTRLNLQLQKISYIYTGYLEKIRRSDDVIVLIHIPESYDFSLASKSKWTEKIENFKTIFWQIFNAPYLQHIFFCWT